jgi:hypothetical protein
MLLCDNCQFKITDLAKAYRNNAGFWRHRKCPKHLPRPVDINCRCSCCGWSFTVHTENLTIESAAYGPGTEWFCPHCGQGVTGQPTISAYAAESCRGEMGGTR